MTDTKIRFHWVRLTSHEEEEAGHILHEASVPAAAEHANDPTEQDDGHRHAHETCRHSPQVWENTKGARLNITRTSRWCSCEERKHEPHMFVLSEKLWKVLISNIIARCCFCFGLTTSPAELHMIVLSVRVSTLQQGKTTRHTGPVLMYCTVQTMHFDTVIWHVKNSHTLSPTDTKPATQIQLSLRVRKTVKTGVSLSPSS